MQLFIAPQAVGLFISLRIHPSLSVHLSVHRTNHHNVPVTEGCDCVHLYVCWTVILSPNTALCLRRTTNTCGICFTELWLSFVPTFRPLMKLQIPETNTRETAERDTGLFKNNYYHQWELVMCCFSEWNYNDMVMFSGNWKTVVLSFSESQRKTILDENISSLDVTYFDVSHVYFSNDWRKKQ